MHIKLTGHHMANRHPVTGVRYTIYHINNELHPEVWDDIYQGTNMSERAMLDDMEMRVRKALEELPDEVLAYLDVELTAEELMDTALVNGMQDTIYCNDEPNYEGETDGIKWCVTWLGGAPHLTVLESPYYGVGEECSPCLPNAVNGCTITTIFRDEGTACLHTQREHGLTYGYALPTTWLRDKEDM